MMALILFVLVSCIIGITSGEALVDVFFPKTMDDDQKYDYINWKDDADEKIIWKDEHTNQGFGTDDVPAGFYALYKKDGDKWERVTWMKPGDGAHLHFEHNDFAEDTAFIVFGVEGDWENPDATLMGKLEEGDKNALEAFEKKLSDDSKLVKSKEKSWKKSGYKRNIIIGICIFTIVVLTLCCTAFFCYQYVFDSSDSSANAPQKRQDYRANQPQTVHPGGYPQHQQYQQNYRQQYLYPQQQNPNYPGWRTV